MITLRTFYDLAIGSLGGIVLILALELRHLQKRVKFLEEWQERVIDREVAAVSRALLFGEYTGPFKQPERPGQIQ